MAETPTHQLLEQGASAFKFRRRVQRNDEGEVGLVAVHREAPLPSLGAVLHEERVVHAHLRREAWSTDPASGRLGADRTKSSMHFCRRSKANARGLIPRLLCGDAEERMQQRAESLAHRAREGPGCPWQDVNRYVGRGDRVVPLRAPSACTHARG